MMQTNLRIEYISIDKLTPYDRNCKIHTAEQIAHIASSINQFGFNDPLGIWGKDNVILEGNGRLDALRMLGIKEAPCIRLDHMSEDERRAYVIAHNHLTLETGFDEEEILRQLQELQDNIDLEALGIAQEKFISELSAIKEKALRPYKKVHYLVSLDVNDNDKLVNLLEQIKKIEGAEIDSTLN
jgi:ParB-like chromosome segregation protein Spo0J